MAAISYPSTLPKALPISGKPESGVIRTSMDTGPAKIRRRFTATAKPLGFVLRLNGTEFGAFRTFYHSTTLEGSLEFDMNDPWDDTTKEFRFTDTYEWQLVVGGEPSDRLYEVTVSMEKLP